MKKIVLIIASVLFCLNVYADQDIEKDKALIETTVRDYVGGWFACDHERLTRAMHPEVVKRIPVVSSKTGVEYLDPASVPKLIHYIKAGYCKLKDNQKPNLKVEVFGIHKNVASAVATNVQFIDYIHLVKQGGKWKIINVVWQYM